MNSAVATRKRKGWVPAVGLFLLAPLVAEFLLGNLPIAMLASLVVLAPLYGGGALLIREAVRRTGRGWPSMIVLALAYGIVEEAFTTQSLFNPNYLSLNLHLLRPAYIPALGMGGWWTVFVLTLHTAWSVSTPVALVEAAVPDRAESPWLGWPGLIVTGLLFFLGVATTTGFQVRQGHFVATRTQLASAALVCAALVAVAFLLPRRRDATGAGWVPNRWVAGALALAAGSAILVTPQGWNWGAVFAILAVDFGMAAAVWVWSRHTGWDMRRKLALGSGATLAYAWHAFIEKPVMAGGVALDRIGNGMFALGAIALIVFAAKRTNAWLEHERR